MILAYLIVLIVLAGAVYIISAPLRAGRSQPGSEAQATQIAELEAAREAKYHEIRDAELDLRTGKLSDEDYEAVDRALRGEAIEIMHALDTAQARDAAPALDTQQAAGTAQPPETPSPARQ